MRVNKLQPHTTRQMNLQYHVEGKKPDTKESDHRKHFGSSSETDKTNPWCFNQGSGWSPQGGSGSDWRGRGGATKVTSRMLTMLLDGMLIEQVGSVCEDL